MSVVWFLSTLILEYVLYLVYCISKYFLNVIYCILTCSTFCLL
jgi:hypothetical protein